MIKDLVNIKDNWLEISFLYCFYHKCKKDFYMFLLLFIIIFKWEICNFFWKNKNHLLNKNQVSVNYIKENKTNEENNRIFYNKKYKNRKILIR